MSGKSGSSSFGLIAAEDQSTFLVLPERFTSRIAQIEGRSHSVIGRYRIDLPLKSSLGIVGTHRSNGDYFNQVVALDGFARPISRTTASVQILGSRTRYPEEFALSHNQITGKFSGWGLESEINYDSRNLEAEIFFETSSDDFRADLGEVDQVGVTHLRFQINPQIYGGPNSWFTRLEFWTAIWEGWDADGNETDEYRVVSFQWYGKAQSHWRTFFQRRGAYIGSETLRVNRVITFLGAEPTSWLDVEINGIFGEGLDFANARVGKQMRLGANMGVRLGVKTDIRFTHTYDRLNAGASNVFRAHLSEMKLIYNFNSRMFVRSILQVRHTRRNPDNYTSVVNRRQTSVFGQILFSYKVNPQSVAFLGYTDNRSGETDSEWMVSSFARENRSVFLKLGYAWRP